MLSTKHDVIQIAHTLIITNSPKNCGPLTAGFLRVMARTFTAAITCCHACVGEVPWGEVPG